MYRKKLLELGIPADLNGFELLNYAIGAYKARQSIIALYDEVGKHYDMTISQTERNMRHAISKVDKKITVGQFIAKYKILWTEE